MNQDLQKNNSKQSSLDGIVRLYWISIVGVILYVALDAIVQSLPPHYSPTRGAESDLVVGPYGYIMTINFLNRGVLSLAFVYSFVKTLDLTGAPRRSFLSGCYLISAWGVGALLLAIFPTDVPALPMSGHGAIHLLVAIIAFICGGLGTFVLSRHFDRNTATKGAKKVALGLGSLSVLLLVVELFAQFLVPHVAANFGGLTERLFLGSVLLWILVVSIYMVTHRSALLGQLQAIAPREENH